MNKELEEVYFRLSRYFYKKGLGTYEEDVELLYKALTRPLDSELRIALSILEGLESDYEVSILGKEKEVKYTNLLRQALRLTPITLDGKKLEFIIETDNPMDVLISLYDRIEIGTTAEEITGHIMFLKDFISNPSPLDSEVEEAIEKAHRYFVNDMHEQKLWNEMIDSVMNKLDSKDKALSDNQSKLNEISEVVNMTHMDFSRKRTNEELTGNTAMVEIKQILGDE